MSTAYKASDYPGVRYREHPTRRRGTRPDRYFVIRYKHNGKSHEEGLGWASEGFSAEQASQVRGQLRQNQKMGSGPMTLAQMRADADAARQALEEAAKSASTIPATFDQLADAYLRWAGANKTDSASDERRLRLHIRPVLGTLPVQAVKQAQIEELKEALAKKKLAQATIKHCVVLVGMIYNNARMRYGQTFGDLVGENPTIGVKKPKIRNKRTRYLHKPEVAKLLQRALNDDPALHDIILLCLYTGLRRGEVERMQAMDVDLSADLIHVRDAKGGDDETVELPDFLKQRMMNHIANLLPGDLVFASTRTGGQLTSISPRFKTLVNSEGLNKGVRDKRHLVVFHTLRHTYISNLVMQGVDLRTVQSLARHRSFEMTLRYAHLAPGRKNRAANQLEPPDSVDVPVPAKTRRRS